MLRSPFSSLAHTSWEPVTTEKKGEENLVVAFQDVQLRHAWLRRSRWTFNTPVMLPYRTVVSSAKGWAVTHNLPHRFLIKIQAHKALHASTKRQYNHRLSNAAGWSLSNLNQPLQKFNKKSAKIEMLCKSTISAVWRILEILSDIQQKKTAAVCLSMNPFQHPTIKNELESNLTTNNSSSSACQAEQSAPWEQRSDEGRIMATTTH